MSKKPRKAAAIDIGSNSCRLLIARQKDGKLVREYYDMRTTRLLEKVESNKILTEAAERRTLTALRNFKQQISKRDICKIQAVGTSALREVNNSQDFCHKIENELSLPVQIISGQEEAELVFAGVSSFPGRKVNMVIDIGGGSTEIISQGNDGPIKALSMNIGAVRYTERYIDNPKELINKSDREKIYKKARKYFAQSNSNLNNTNGIEFVFGVGGTITTLVAIAEHMEKYQPWKVENFSLTKTRVETITNFLSNKDIEERRRVPGLNPERADVIVAGSLILLAFMTGFSLDRIKVSDRGFLFGIISKYLL